MIIGILGALPEEIDLLVGKLKNRKTQRLSGVTFHRGRLANKSTVIAAGGEAKVNASAATELLITYFHATHVIFNGTAGALAPGLKVGDLVVSTKTQQYDINFSAIGVPIGKVPNLPANFLASPELIHAAKRASSTLPTKQSTHFGKIITGESFIAKPVVAQRLRRAFHGLCVETEGAATGQVCYRNKKPYLVIRGISDIPGHKFTPEQFKLAARRAQRLTLATLSVL